MAIFYFGGKILPGFVKMQLGTGYYKTTSSDSKKYIQDLPGEFSFFTSNPIVDSETGYTDIPKGKPINQIVELLSNLQNTVASLYIKQSESGPILTSASCHIGRPKMFFLSSNDGCFFSDDLRELIPYSSATLNYTGIYSILKFGNTPEFLTPVRDIYSIPVSCYWQVSLHDLSQKQKVELTDFKFYHKITYAFSGGDIGATEQLLHKTLRYVANRGNFIVPISGGIDSSLINYIINDLYEKPYPAYYMAFGDNDSEIPYAIEAVRSTKAELQVYKMYPEDFIDSFEFQARNIHQPIGETSSIAMSKIFYSDKLNGMLALDGTLADGCYGSKDYQQNLFEGVKQPSSLKLKLNEKIESWLQLYNLPFNDRFYPRDSFIQDVYLRFMNVYCGPLLNTHFTNAQAINQSIEPYWKNYYNMIEGVSDDWVNYTVFKMVNYAANTTTAKTYDLCGSTNQMFYPFMFKDVLKDQGRYSWLEKTKNGIIKYPLKKIIEKYASHEFIYRKKVGLNSSTEQWLSLADNKQYIYKTVEKAGGVAEVMVGRQTLKQLLRVFNTPRHHPQIDALMMSLAMMQRWRESNNLS